MNIVVDTNIFLAALIKEGLVRDLIINSKNNLLFPEFEFEEIRNHKLEIIQKSQQSEKELNILILRLLKYVKIIPADIVSPYRSEACEIMGQIDQDDVPFIATALAFNASIWSDDKHFKKQDRVNILTTKDIINLAGD